MEVFLSQPLTFCLGEVCRYLDKSSDLSSRNLKAKLFEGFLCSPSAGL